MKNAIVRAHLILAVALAGPAGAAVRGALLDRATLGPVTRYMGEQLRRNLDRTLSAPPRCSRERPSLVEKSRPRSLN